MHTPVAAFTGFPKIDISVGGLLPNPKPRGGGCLIWAGTPWAQAPPQGSLKGCLLVLAKALIQWPRPTSAMLGGRKPASGDQQL